MNSNRIPKFCKLAECFISRENRCGHGSEGRPLQPHPESDYGISELIDRNSLFQRRGRAPDKSTVKR